MTTSLFLDRRGISNPETPTRMRIMIRHHNSVASIPLDIRLAETQWDGEHVVNHPKANQLNIVLRKCIADAETALILKSMTMPADFKDAGQIKDFLVDSLFKSQKRSAPQPENLFIPIYNSFMESRKSEGTRGIYRSALRWIRIYDPLIDGKSISDLDRNWAKGLEMEMAKKNTENARNILLRSVRAVFNYAISEDIISSNPFKGMDLNPKETIKRSMGVETLREIRDAEVDDWQVEYRDMFMLMFYLIGINAADLFLAKKSQLCGDRLEYIRKKTGKRYSIKVEPEAMAIIKKYEGKDWLLSPMDRYCDYKSYLGHMNRALSKLGLHYNTNSKVKGKAIFDKLSTYWSRHTWATLAYDIGISIDVIGQALGHSDTKHSVTMIYIKMDNRKVDEANRKVIDHLNGQRQCLQPSSQTTSASDMAASPAT